jgi:hypothetical protein
VGDYAVYTGSVWARSSGATGTVTSVGVSRDGNALTITGSPVTSSGTINLGFSGDNTQYINGAGNLTTFPTVINSIGLTMPAAFGVSNSPLTANGTIGVTALGYPSQYIRGDGTLADFPTSGGGGSSVSYYFNGGTSQGTIGGTTYYEMSKTADTGTGVDFNKTGDGFIVAFLTDANDPNLLQIPAGNWNYEIYASMSSNGGTPEMYAELYVYNGTTFTLLSTSSHEILYDGVNLNLYTFAMAVPETVLTVTDRLAIKLYADNSGGKTTTIHTQDSHLCQVITTFSTGLTALNGLTAQVQYFGTGTSGSDFNIVSSVATHTFNIPSASATARGLITTGTQTIAGSKTITGTTTFTGGPILSDTNLTYANSGFTLVLQSPTLSVNRTVTLPNGTGTLALTSDISYPVTSVFGRTGAVVATSGDYTTTQVTEGTNLYFTDARARTAISLTTTGSTGAATYNNTTGVLNIPNYADQYVGTVTSVAMSVPTGLTVSGSPITTSGTLAVTLTAGYSIPTTANQSTWTTAYNRSLTSAAVTGTTTKTLTLNQQDGGTITASWTDINTDAVTSVFGRTGAVVATEGDYTLTQLGDVTITSPTTGQVLKYNGTAWINDTDANTGTVTSVAMTVPTGLSIAGSPITSSGTLAVTFAAGYSIPTNASQTTWDTAYTNRITSATGPLSITSNVISISQSSGSTNGYLSNTDWTIFNNKQATISLTTTGTSGAATLVGSTLNIPNYTTDLSGYVTLATNQTITAPKTFNAIVTGGTGDYTDMSSYPLKIAALSTYWRIPHLSISSIISGVYNYETGKTVYWGEPTDTGDYIFRGRTLKVDAGTLYLVIHTGNLSNITATGTIGSGTWQGTAIADAYIASAATWNAKQGAITLTTTGTSGAATFTSNTLNIPNYGSALSGYLPLSGGTLTGPLGGTAATFSGTIQGALLASGGTAYPNVAVTIKGTINGNNDSWGIYQGAVTYAPNLNNSLAVAYGAGGTVNTGTYTGLSYRGFYLQSLNANTGTGTLATAYGVYIDSLTTATNNYSAYFAQNVGIGTATPSYPLDVNGIGRFYSAQPDIILNATSTSQYSRLIFLENGVEKGGMEYINSAFSATARRKKLEIFNADGINFVSSSFTSPDVEFTTGVSTFNTTTKIVGKEFYLSSGNAITFDGAASGNNPYIYYNSGGNQMYIRNNITNGLISIGNQNGTLSFASTGIGSFSNSVSIAQTNNAAYLDVYGVGGTSTSSSIAVRNGNSDGNYNAKQILFGYSSTVLYAHAIKTRHQSASAAGNAFDFFVWKYGDDSSTQAGQMVASIEGDGVKIANSSGTHATGYGSNRLVVNGGIYGTSSIAAVVPSDIDMFVFQNTGATYTKACIVASMTATGGTGSYFFYGQQNTSTVALKIFSNGNIQNTNNSYGAISDARLKENIKDATPKLDDLMKVKVRNYNLKGESNKQLGVISQELEEIFPNMIEESTNMGENIKIKGVKYSVFVPMLIKAVQELKAEIEILKNK